MVKSLFLAKVLLITLAVFILPVCMFAQGIEQVTLTVSGDGATKKEATDIALRSAVEQAFGVFVSANTKILNDSLVKDEIATVSSGNIKNYEEIAYLILPNGNTSVTIKAIVSISKLVKYAESHNSTVEFAGATFGANMRLKEFNKANEEKALENLITQLEALAPKMFDYKLEMGEPKMSRDEKEYNIDAKIYVYHNENTEVASTLLLKTLSSLSLSDTEVKEYKQINIPIYLLTVGNFFYSQSTTGGISPLIMKFIKPLNPDGEHQQYYNNFLQEYMVSSSYSAYKGSKCDVLTYYFRSEKTMERLRILMDILLSDGVFNFNIKDNQGQSSMIELSEEQCKYIGLIKDVSPLILGFREDLGWQYGLDFHFRQRRAPENCIVIPHLFKDKLAKKDGLLLCYMLYLKMNIPIKDISKYSKFTVERKSTTL